MAEVKLGFLLCRRDHVIMSQSFGTKSAFGTTNSYSATVCASVEFAGGGCAGAVDGGGLAVLHKAGLAALLRGPDGRPVRARLPPALPTARRAVRVQCSAPNQVPTFPSPD